MKKDEIKNETPADAKPVLAAVAYIEEIEQVAIQFFENKYPLMDLQNASDNDKDEIGWNDMLQFVQHILSYKANVNGRSKQLFCECEIKGSSFQLDNGVICCCKCEKERAK